MRLHTTDWPTALLLLLVSGAIACTEPTAPTRAGGAEAAVTTTAAITFRAINAGAIHTCGVATDNRAYCWGGESFGQLGGGTSTIHRPQAAIPNLRFLDVRAGSEFSCGLTTDSLVYCWGRNTEGQLGAGSTAQNSFQALKVAGSRRYKQVRTGGAHACAITTGGVLYCWGGNSHGEVGDSTTQDRRSPVKVLSNNHFLSATTGFTFTCALTTGRKPYCWGANGEGQLGIRNSITQLKPVAVSDGHLFNAISAGTLHTCAVDANHQAYCWGFNSTGQLGDGTRNRRSRPTLVAGGLSFSGVSPGNGHTCGVTTTKKVYCWGYNSNGQLGNGSTSSGVGSLAPIPVLGGHLFSWVSAGQTNWTCGVSGGQGYCWGFNGLGGLLGDGTTTDRSVPTKVAEP